MKINILSQTNNIILLSLIFFQIYTSNIYSQIKLPKGFRCESGENNINESYFTDGNYKFNLYPWGHDGISGMEVVTLIQENFNDNIKLKKTKDGLYWGTGKEDGLYYYVILLDGNLQFTLQSKTNNIQFSNYSKWLLQKIRSNKKEGMEFYFTNYRGESCN